MSTMNSGPLPNSSGTPPEAPPRYLIVNSDDFGRSSSINQAVLQAHQNGILTTASLMVNEPACAEAVQIAKNNPRLGVGLHLTLLCGRAALTPEKIPGLVDSSGSFTNNPVAAGMRYFFIRSLRKQLENEIAAQFERFHATGLPLDHVDGHLHIHLHPIVFSILMEHAREWGIRHMRFTRDPFRVNARIAKGFWAYRISHHLIYQALSASARPALQRLHIKHTERVYGLLQNDRMNEDYLVKLLPEIPAGTSEVYAHPSLDSHRHEYDALVSPNVKQLTTRHHIKLIRYQDIPSH